MGQPVLVETGILIYRFSGSSVLIFPVQVTTTLVQPFAEARNPGAYVWPESGVCVHSRPGVPAQSLSCFSAETESSYWSASSATEEFPLVLSCAASLTPFFEPGNLLPLSFVYSPVSCHPPTLSAASLLTPLATALPRFPPPFPACQAASSANIASVA